MDAPPLHERTFSRTLPRKRGWCRAVIGMGLAHHCLYLSLLHHSCNSSIPKSGGRAGSQTRICSFGRYRVVQLHYPPLGTRAGNPTRTSSLGPKRHHALDHASQNWKGCIELNSDLTIRSRTPKDESRPRRSSQRSIWTIRNRIRDVHERRTDDPTKSNSFPVQIFTGDLKRSVLFCHYSYRAETLNILLWRTSLK